MEDIDPLNPTEELAIHAFQSFGETEELRQQQLQLLRDRIQALPNPSDQLKDLSDGNLIRFLRSKKFRLEKALQSTIDYQHFLDSHATALANITSDEIMFFNGVFTLLVEPSHSTDHGKGGRVILILEMKKLIERITSEYKQAHPKFMIRLRYFLFERLSFNARAQIFGTILLFSCQGLSFWQQLYVSQLSPPSDHLACFQHFQILGTRFKGAYTFEEPPFISWLWFFVSPILSEKIKQRFHFCGHDQSKMHAVVADVSILPKFLGGNRDNDDCGDWLTKQCLKVFGK